MPWWRHRERLSATPRCVAEVKCSRPIASVVYNIAYSSSVAEDLKSLRASDRSRILDQIEVQLSHEPTRETRNRKKLSGLVPPWLHVPPVWELRIGEYRAFYDVDEMAASVMVRAIRHKPAHRRTEEIL